MAQHHPASHVASRPTRLALRVALASVFAASGLATGTLAQSAAPADVASSDPACDLAFRMAAPSAPVTSTPTASGAQDPSSTAADGLPVGTPRSVDATIRACGSLAAWAAAAERYPQALAGHDSLWLLLERCADPAAGLAEAPACVALVQPPVSPGPSLMPTPAASPSSTAAPSLTPAPSPTMTPSPVPTSTLAASRPSAEARVVRLPRFDARVKGADRVRTFAIRGSTPEELLQAMQVGAAAVCPQHASACTQTQPRIRPRIATNARTGSCRVTGLQISTDDTVHIPRWAGPQRVYPELVAWWREVNAHIRWHEAQHIRITKRHLATLRKRIVGKSCQRISLEVQRVSQRAMQDHQAFDLRDQGWLPTYDGPRP